MKILYNGEYKEVIFAPGKTTEVDDNIIFHATEQGMLIKKFKSGILREAPTLYTYTGTSSQEIFKFEFEEKKHISWINQDKYKKFIESKLSKNSDEENFFIKAKKKSLSKA